MSEEEVIREIRKGGRAADVALRALYDGCARHMLRFFVYSGVSGDEAKDILQETLVRLVRHVDSYNGDGAARSWIWQIARNCLTDHQRRSGRWSELVVAVDDEQWDRIAETHASPAACAPGETVDECVSRGLEAFGAQMPERALALTLQMDGLSIAEIGERLGRTAAATKEYLSQCRKKIQPFIGHCAELMVS
ncbi:MAG: RNA polymerase sigma factor [Pseudomonadota bacterium]|jgi:RNA polymerase sigma-70 factor (ECF subfamily)